jgi:hypothetical protein
VNDGKILNAVSVQAEPNLSIFVVNEGLEIFARLGVEN